MSFPALFFFFSSRRRHTRSLRDWSSDVCSSDLELRVPDGADAGLSLLDPTGTPRLGMVATADGRPMLATRGADGAPRLLLGESPEGAATLRLSAGDGSFRALLGVAPDGGGSLTFRD